jgi:gamma-glutamyl:cysteine ligase YbdK (ATP-grasp superfamily)
MNAAPEPLHAFSVFGIELEYMIVDRHSLDVRPVADALLRKIAAAGAKTDATNIDWSNELVRHLVELKNPVPHARLDGLTAGFQEEVARADGLLAEFGARLMPGAMHPWMSPALETQLWPHDNEAIYRTYDRIFDCRTHGWANIQSMHVNLPFADDEEFARLHAAVRLVLPILPALAASSPVADGRVCADLDSRLTCYRRHPARVPSLMGRFIPDNATGRANYEATVLAPMYREIAPLDPEGVLRHEWLNARAAIPRFDRNALEIRVIDVQECPQVDIAIAALTSAVVRSLYSCRWSTLAEQQRMATESLASIIDACIHAADHALIDNADYLALFGFPQRRCEARELWQYLLDAAAADPLMSAAHRGPLDNILTHGPLARRIMRVLGQGFSRVQLAAVYLQLCDCLAEGRLFEGSGA